MVKNQPGRADHAAPTVPWARRARKAVTAACGMAATLAAAGVLDDQAETVVTALLGVATAYGVWRIPNQT